MPKKLVICEKAGIAAIMEKEKAIEFFFDNTEFAVGNIYVARVENILAGIDAVFLSLGNSDKMGFLHASDIPGFGPLHKRIFPKQKMLVQIVKEPTGNKGPRINTDLNLIGRFFVLTTGNEQIILSRRISNPNERARLKAIANLLKPPSGFGLVIRTEAEGASESELEADFQELFLERFKYIIDQFENQKKPGLLIKDSRSLLYRVLRDVFHNSVDTIAVDSPEAAQTVQHYVQLWSKRSVTVDVEESPTELLTKYSVAQELESALSNKVELESGGYILIQATEAMTVIDVNSGKFTSLNDPNETVLKTNIEAATEISKQLRLRNIGGVVVIDFIDMDDKYHRLKVLEHFEKLLEQDPTKPQIGRLSDLGLVEVTRHRQEQSLEETLGTICDKCHGQGRVFSILDHIANHKPPATQPIPETRSKGTIAEESPLPTQPSNKYNKSIQTEPKPKSEEDIIKELLGSENIDDNHYDPIKELEEALIDNTPSDTTKTKRSKPPHKDKSNISTKPDKPSPIEDKAQTINSEDSVNQIEAMDNNDAGSQQSPISPLQQISSSVEDLNPKNGVPGLFQLDE